MSSRSTDWEYYNPNLKASHVSAKRNLRGRVPKLKLMETTLGSDWSSEGVELRETRTTCIQECASFF
jgi:hypothetical protein